MRAQAITQGKVADIFYTRGELDEALRILRKEELPVFQRLGDLRARAITKVRMAQISADRHEEAAAEELLVEALDDAQRLGIPEAESIDSMLAQMRRGSASAGS